MAAEKNIQKNIGKRLLVKDLCITPISMVAKNGLQRIEISYDSSAAAHVMLYVLGEHGAVYVEHPIALDSGRRKTVVMLSPPEKAFDATWRLIDRSGECVAEKLIRWERPRELTVFVMVSSHTDIGLHNSPYIQRHNSEQFIDKAKQLCDETYDREENDQYRYTMEGTWFWNNYGMDRGKDAADHIVNNYIKTGKIGTCAGVAGNHTQVYGLEEMCRSTYERKRLFEDWNIESETLAMIDNNGMAMSIIQPYYDAGYKNVIFAPNHWNPLMSTVWNMDRLKCEYGGFNFNPNAGGGGSRVDISYDSALPMVFYWEDENENRLLVWASTQYNHGGASFGLFPRKKMDKNTIPLMEAYMARHLPQFEEKYPYDIWLIACYWDDQEPDIQLTDSIKAWNAKWQWPQIRTLGNPDVPFNLLRERYEDQIPVLKGDITGGWYQHPVATPELLAQKFEVDRLLPTAEKWAAVASILDDQYQYPAEDFRRAWDALLFNDEHSYGVSGYQGRRVYETWMQHRDWINSASEIAQRECSVALQTIARKISSDEKQLVVFNPTALERREMILSEDGERYAVIDVPPFGYRMVNGNELSSSSRTVEIPDAPPSIENRYYKLTFAKNGSIQSIIDKELGRELLDQENPFHANEVVYTKDNHETYAVSKKAVFEIIKETERITVVSRMEVDSLGAEIVQSVSLPQWEKRIDIDNKLFHVRDMVNTNRYARYLYYAFPFAVEDCRRFCHLNGAIAEYAKDVTGHGTDVYMAVNEWCCAENQQYGVALLMLDSQLIEFDHIHEDKTDFGDTGDGSQMFAYVANDWLQMHLPGGEHLNYRFRYSIISYKGSYAQAKIPETAERYGNEVQAIVIPKQQGGLEGYSRSFMRVDSGQRLICLKRADDGQGIIARLYGKPQTVHFNMDMEIEGIPEPVQIDESSLREGNMEKRSKAMSAAAAKGMRFATYRLGRKNVCLKTGSSKRLTAASDVPSQIGSNYTGLITKPCAASGEQSGHLYLLWGQNTEEDLSHYRLYRDESPDFAACEDNLIAEVLPEEYQVARYEDTGLKEHTTYYYRVCAVNKRGYCGEISDVFFGITREALEHKENLPDDGKTPPVRLGMSDFDR